MFGRQKSEIRTAEIRTAETRKNVGAWAERAEDLEVFRRAYALSLEIHRVTLEFAAIEQRALADQMRRASKSICANLAEGFGRQRMSKPEFGRFLMMAIGSSDEMQIWTLYARDLGYLRAETAQRWRGEYREIARMLWGLRRGGSDH
jgi:four helix bundle protein